MSTTARPTLTVVPPPPDELTQRREQRRAETETLTCPCGSTKWRTEWIRFADPDGTGYVVVGHGQPVWCVDCGQEMAVPGWIE